MSRNINAMKGEDPIGWEPRTRDPVKCDGWPYGIEVKAGTLAAVDHWFSDPRGQAEALSAYEEWHHSRDRDHNYYWREVFLEGFKAGFAKGFEIVP